MKDLLSGFTFAFYIFNFAFSFTHDGCAGEMVVCCAPFGVKQCVKNTESECDKRYDVEDGSSD